MEIVKNDEVFVNAYINKDLKMGKGKIIGQVCHSIHYMTKKIEMMKSQNVCPNICEKYKKWQETGYKIKIHKVSQNELMELKNNKESTVVIDFGHTQIAPNSMTVVSFYPGFTCDENNISENFNESSVIECGYNIDAESSAMYIFINTDLNLTLDDIVCEASKVTNNIVKLFESMTDLNDIPETYTNYKKWDAECCTKIILKANTAQLEELKLANNTIHTTWNNEDYYSKDPDIVSIVAFYPNVKSNLRNYTSGYRLL